MSKQWQMTCYTRKPLEADIYSEKLAYSLHLAIQTPDCNVEPLNSDSGILYAKAIVQEDGTLKAKSLVNPIIFKSASTYGVLARRVEADGTNESDAVQTYLYFQTNNFTEYNLVEEIQIKEQSFLKLLDCQYNSNSDTYIFYWTNSLQDNYAFEVENVSQLSEVNQPLSIKVDAKSVYKWNRSDIIQGNTLVIDEQLAQHLQNKLSPIKHIASAVPQQINLKDIDQLNQVKALLTYSDGSTAEREVEWDLSHIDVNLNGPQLVKGKIKGSYFKYPIALHRADPNIFYYNNLFYYIATDDTTNGNLNFYVRAAKTIAELEQAKEHLILNNEMYPEINKFLWAPEFHMIDDKVYILFASSPHEFGEIRCHVLELKDGGNILKKEDWKYPKVFLKQSGEELFTQGITLDMTYLQFNHKHYVIWAQRQLKPVDNGSWLYIATISPEKPWQLTSEPIVISKPEYGWANNQTFVDEGPYAIVKDDKLYITFSSALVNATYCVGIMSIDKGKDLLNEENWFKRQYPILTSRSISGQFGPGHNSYVTDLDGTLLNVYHAKTDINGPRSTGIRPVHFGFDGEPVLNMTESQFLNEQLKEVTTEILLNVKESIE